MPDLTSKKAVQEIARQVAGLIGSQLDGPFSVIRHPAGFNYTIDYSIPVYFNPNTLQLLYKSCTVDDNGVVSLSRGSFSNLYANILRNVVFVQSSGDAKALNALLRDFNKQSDKLIKVFEKSFGKITEAKIQAAGCVPPTPITYVYDYVQKNFYGSTANMGPNLTTFATLYDAWLSMSRKVKKLSAIQPDAQQEVATALNNTTDPGAANGGLQTTATSWGVAYDGLPTNNQIMDSLDSDNRSLTVQVTLKGLAGGEVALSMQNQELGSLAKSALQLSFTDPATTARQQNVNPWQSADRIEMSVAYSGITVISARPADLSTNLKTGWFSGDILDQVTTKTGKYATGLQLSGSGYSVNDLLGVGKASARVKTYVISREPTITLRLYGAHQTALVASFKTNDPVQVALGEIFALGGFDGGLRVSGISDNETVTTIVLAPPEPNGTTTPPVDRRTHIIGGVVDYPPDG